MKWSSWLRGRLTWKYVAVLVSLVVAALLASGLTEAYFSYQDNRRALNRIHLEKASSAAALIEQFVEGLHNQVSDVARSEGLGERKHRFPAAARPRGRGLDGQVPRLVRTGAASDLTLLGEPRRPRPRLRQNSGVPGRPSAGNVLRPPLLPSRLAPPPDAVCPRTSTGPRRGRGGDRPSVRRGSDQAGASRIRGIRLCGRLSWPARGPSEHRPRARESRFRPPAAGAVRAVGLCQNRDQRRGDRAQLARQEGPQRLSDGRSAGLARVRGGAVERRLLSARVRPGPYGAAPGRLPRSGRRRERSACPEDGSADRVDAGRIGEDRRRRARPQDRGHEEGRARDARRGVQQDGRAAAGVLRGPGGEGRGADPGARDGAGRARREEPPARDRQPSQVGVPSKHVARAADAAERDHRLLRRPARADVRGAERATARLRRRRPRGRSPPAVADQRHARPLEGRGRADGARAERGVVAGDPEERIDDARGAREPEQGRRSAWRSTRRRSACRPTSARSARSCSTSSRTRSSSPRREAGST